jgi:hypothetical protein
VTLRTSALAVIAAGVASLVLGLYGIPQQFSLEIAIGGLALLLVGLGTFLFTLRASHPRAPSVAIFAIVALAVSLHAYENFSPASDQFSLGFFIWSLAPYMLCLIVASISTQSAPAIVGASAALLFDVAMHVEIAKSTHSTAGLGYLFMPLWNLLIIAPLSIFFVSWVAKKSRSQDNAP